MCRRRKRKRRGAGGERGGLDEKFAGGNVITETLAASLVTAAMLQNTAIRCKLPPPQNCDMGENRRELLLH